MKRKTRSLHVGRSGPSIPVSPYTEAIMASVFFIFRRWSRWPGIEEY